MQGHGFATGNWTHGNAVTHRCAGQLFEHMITAAVWMEVKPGLFGIFKQHTRTHHGAGDTSDESLEQAFEFDVSRYRRTMKPSPAVGERIRTVRHQHMCCAVAACCSHLSQASPQRPPGNWSCPPSMVLGLAFYMFHNTLQTLATEMSPSARGLAISAFAFCLFCGQAIGVSAGGPLAQWLGYRPVFAIAGIARNTLRTATAHAVDEPGEPDPVRLDPDPAIDHSVHQMRL
jgi:hypothetical protein